MNNLNEIEKCDYCNHMKEKFLEKWPKRGIPSPFAKFGYSRDNDLRIRLTDCNSYAKWIKILLDFHEYFYIEHSKEPLIDIAATYLTELYHTPILIIKHKDHTDFCDAAKILLPDLGYRCYYQKDLYESNGSAMHALDQFHTSTNHKSKIQDHYCTINKPLLYTNRYFTRSTHT